MISVLGLGYVGLTTALGFSEKGFQVYGYDTDQSRLARIREGHIPFHEPKLREACKKYIGGHFYVTETLKQAVEKGEIIFLCVGTPEKKEGSADLSYLCSAIKQILQGIDKASFKVLVIRSSVPPPMTSRIIKPLIEEHGFIVGKDIGLANNPEFLREGYAWSDFVHPDRVVIGVEDNKSKERLKEIFKPFQAPIYTVSLNTGEFIKYLSNTLLSTLISFSNEMSILANTIGEIDIPESFHILHQDKRWFGHPANMTSYVYPGCGFGGSCLPKDTKAIYHLSKSNGLAPTILKGVIDTNERVKNYVVTQLIKDISPETAIGILGLSFKPGSDDIRETPAKDIICKLISKGYRNIYAYDPLAIDGFRKTYDIDIKYIYNLEDLLEKVDHVVILTAWEEFKEKQSLFDQKKLFDFRYFINEGA